MKQFGEVVNVHGRKADGAMYWKAYALNKAGNKAQALTSIGELRRNYPKSNWLRAGVAQPVALGIVPAQFADRRQGLGLIARLVQGISLPVHCAIGLAAVDLYHLIKLPDGVVICAIIQSVLGGLIKLVFMRVGFLRGLRVQQRSRGDLLPSGGGRQPERNNNIQK